MGTGRRYTFLFSFSLSTVFPLLHCKEGEEEKEEEDDEVSLVLFVLILAVGLYNGLRCTLID